MRKPGVSAALCLAVLAIAAGRAPAADVTLNGTEIARATSTMSVHVDVTEFRDGGSLCAQLIRGCAKPTVCVNAPAPVAALDAQLAGAAPAKFTVGVEDGRHFAQCVLASLDTTGAASKRRYAYCLLCEGITGP